MFNKKRFLKIVKNERAIALTEDYKPGKNGGVHFLVLGWDTIDGYPVTHPIYHFFPGTFTGDGPWTLKTENGDFIFAEVKPDDPLYHYYEDWLEVKKAQGITDEVAKEALEEMIKGADNVT